jgi:hypothetical protein
MIVDAKGNLYVVDPFRFRVCRLTPAGQLTVAAGNGYKDALDRGTFSGDGGPAAQASLYEPGGIAVDAAGNLFIADDMNERIRKVNTAGIITTVVANIPIETVDGITYAKGGFEGDGGPADQALLSSPTDVAIDGNGNLLIADYGNYRVRKAYGIAAPGVIAGHALPGNGDVNRDGQVNVSDVIQALQAVLGTASLSPEQTAVADRNADGQLAPRDVTSLLRKAVGLAD